MTDRLRRLLKPAFVTAILHNRHRHRQLHAILPDLAADAAPRVLVFGHSHMQAIRRGWTKGHFERSGAAMGFVSLRADAFQPNMRRDTGEMDADCTRQIGALLRKVRPDAVLCVVMGNEYNTLSMVRHPEPFTLPGIAAPDATPVPRWLMEAQIRAKAEINALAIWRGIAEQADCPVWLAPPPPPIPDEDHIRAYPNRFGALVERYGLNPPELRRALWEIYRDTLRDGVAGSDTRFLDLPEAIFDAEGNLARRYWQKDPTHANGVYGGVLLAHFFEALDRGAQG